MSATRRVECYVCARFIDEVDAKADPTLPRDKRNVRCAECFNPEDDHQFSSSTYCSFSGGEHQPDLSTLCDNRDYMRYRVDCALCGWDGVATIKLAAEDVQW